MPGSSGSCGDEETEVERLKSDGTVEIWAFDSFFLWRCLKGVVEIPLSIFQ
jgi:hypothetical protein